MTKNCELSVNLKYRFVPVEQLTLLYSLYQLDLETLKIKQYHKFWLSKMACHKTIAITEILWFWLKKTNWKQFIINFKKCSFGREKKSSDQQCCQLQQYKPLLWQTSTPKIEKKLGCSNFWLGRRSTNKVARLNWSVRSQSTRSPASTQLDVNKIKNKNHSHEHFN